MILDISTLTPSDFDLPSKFPSFRPVQAEMADFLLHGPGGIEKVGTTSGLARRRFHAAGLPAGCGKSLGAHLIGRLSGMKYVVLTKTLALQKQQVDDGFDAVNIRGRSNYTCIDEDLDGVNGGEATCEDGVNGGCRHLGKETCTHGGVVARVKVARGVISNYACWLHTRAYGTGGWEGKRTEDKIGLLILDEADLAFESLASFLSTWVSSHDFNKFVSSEYRVVMRETKGEEWGRVDAAWLTLLDLTLVGVQAAKADIELHYTSAADAWRNSDDYKRLDKLSAALTRVVSLGRDNNWLWVLTNHGVSFKCVWPGRYAERYLWSGVANVVLMSATLRPKSLSMLGLRGTDYHFREWPRQFDSRLNPVWWIPTGRMGRKAGNEELARAVAKADEIYDAWAPGHKGVVHTHSYPRMEKWQRESRWGRCMITNQSGEAEAKAERFKKSKAPAILIGPSYATGFDFPGCGSAEGVVYPTCEWIHIPKMPYPDKSDPVVIARCEDDPNYYDAETMRTLVQATLRGNRTETDRCTVAITDDAVGNFRNYAKMYAPRYFKVGKWERGGVSRL